MIAGMIGREGEMGAHVTGQITKMIPLLESHIADGTITPVDCELFDGVGWEPLKDAISFFEAGKSKKKLIVRVQEG